MGDTPAGLLQVLALLVLLAVAYVPLGDYLARVFTTEELASSRLAAGAVTPLLAPIGYDEVAVRAMAGLDPAGRVVLDIDETLPDVLADAGLLERVVANVVDNALRYAGAGSIVLRASTHRERVELRVVDTGPGVPPRERDGLFTPFRRLDGDPSDRDGRDGVGLGLAVARGFADLMGGSLTAEDTPGGGLTVVVSLPVARVVA